MIFIWWLEKELQKIEKEPAYKVNGRDKVFAQQLWENGFHDGHTYCLHVSLAELILPRLKRYKELAVNKIVINFPLDDMIKAFEIMERHNHDTWEFSLEEAEQVQTGLKAFSEYFFALWW